MATKQIELDDVFEKTFSISDDVVQNFGIVSKDFNPIHFDDEYASKTIFKKRIAHGMILASYISSMLGNDFPGHGTIYLNQSLAFKAPVFINDKISIQLKVVDIGDRGKLNIATTCVNQNNVIVLDGIAKVIAS